MRDLTRKLGYTWGGGFRVFKPHKDSLNAKVKELLKKGDVEMAKNLLTPLLRSGVMRLTDMGNMLIELFGKHGCVDEARLVFDKIHRPNNSTWYFMIQACASQGLVEQARWFYEQMPKPNLLFSVSHNLLLGAYIATGRMQEALALFRSVPEPTTVSWGIMFEGMVKHGHLQGARTLLSALPRRVDVAWVSIINIYARYGHMQQAKEAFDSMPEKTPLAYSAVVIALVRLDRMTEAQKIFDQSPTLDDEAWNVMITAHAQRGDCLKARQLFLACPHRANQVTCIAMIFSFGREGDVKAAEIIYDRIQIKSVVVKNAMLTAYALNRRLNQAWDIFRTTQDRNVVTWTNMTHAYLLRNATLKSKALFDQMPYESKVASNAMAAAYAKRGHFHDAKMLYDASRNALTSSIMVLGCARFKRRDALPFFHLMNLEGQRPDEFTFTCLLVACGFGGMPKEAMNLLAGMYTDFGVSPCLEHYFCTVEALGHNGKLDEAEDLARHMPFMVSEEPSAVLAALVAAARSCGDEARAQRWMEGVKKKLREQLGNRKEPLINPKLLLDSVIATSYMQDEMVIRKRMHGSPRFLEYLSIPLDTQAEPVLVTPFA